MITPKVSVICIALREEEFKPILETLASQTFQDFELILETGGTIPEAWNRAVARAKGEILVFTETDAQPVTNTWLEELVNSVPDENTVVKGLEVTGQPWDMSNLAAHRRVFEKGGFDEAFLWSEDTELFCRLQENGVTLQQVHCAPVIHLSKYISKRMIRRAFKYGRYWARLRHRFPESQLIIQPSDMFKQLVKNLLNIIGYLFGYLFFLYDKNKLKS